MVSFLKLHVNMKNRYRTSGRLAASAAAFAVALTLLGLISGTALKPSSPNKTAAEKRCGSCHAKISESYTETAHFGTSRPVSAEAIHGSFEPGKNVLITRKASTLFEMSREGNEYFQTAHWRNGREEKSRRERFDIVVGSGREGQTYLFWRNGLLYQLPVSYLSGIDRWVNSPGFEDGVVNFDRVIPPECLECHATSFQLALSADSRPVYRENFVLGIQCEKCHGDGSRHIAYHGGQPAPTESRYIINPGRLSREHQLDNCALCHSGLRTPLRAPFTYAPGNDLNQYYLPAADQDAGKLDVHGNQVGLLKSSECFKQSEEMNCSTCHDVHRTERDVALMSQKCLQCHRQIDCKMSERVGTSLGDLCVDCHMPDQESKVLSINLPKGEVSPAYRNHQIRVYPRTARDVLKRLDKGDR